MPDPGPSGPPDPSPAESNLPRVLGIYEALSRRDWVDLQRRVAVDVVVTVGGKSRFAGIYRGMGSVLALAARLEEQLLPGRSTLEDIRDEGHTVWARVTVAVRRRDDGHLQAALNEVFRFDDRGLVQEIEITAEDQAQVDSFLDL